MSYHSIGSGEVPPGYASVPVKIADNGVEFDAVMVAGSVGIKPTSSDNRTKSYGRGHKDAVSVDSA